MRVSVRERERRRDSERQREIEREIEREATAREDQAKMNEKPDTPANEKVESYVENGGC